MHNTITPRFWENTLLKKNRRRFWSPMLNSKPWKRGCKKYREHYKEEIKNHKRPARFWAGEGLNIDKRQFLQQGYETKPLDTSNNSSEQDYFNYRVANTAEPRQQLQKGHGKRGRQDRNMRSNLCPWKRTFVCPICAPSFDWMKDVNLFAKKLALKNQYLWLLKKRSKG